MVRLVLVLGDQLTPAVAALRAADKVRDVVVMAEVMGEGQSVPHHPQKIALILSAMRHFAGALRAEGWTVAYTPLDDPDNSRPSRANCCAARHSTGPAKSSPPTPANGACWPIWRRCR